MLLTVIFIRLDIIIQILLLWYGMNVDMINDVFENVFVENIV